MFNEKNLNINKMLNLLKYIIYFKNIFFKITKKTLFNVLIT